jgi:hypothetical protein
MIMTNPTENIASSTDLTLNLPEQPKSQVETQSKTYEVHRQALEMQKDNAEFLNALERMPVAERQQIIDRAQQWANQGDLDLLRAAGLTLDQIKKNPLERHIKLAAAFLKRVPSPDSLSFAIDFNNNDLAQFSGDLTDLLPANILVVDIFDRNGKKVFENAKRTVRNQKPCYVTPANPPEPEKIAFVKTGFQIQVKETQSSTALLDEYRGGTSRLKQQEEERFLTDNAHKTEIKDQVRTEAAKQGKQVVTDQNFFDVILTDFLKAIDQSKKDGKFSFTVLLEQIGNLINKIGYKTNPQNTGFEKKEADKPAAPAVPAAKAVKAAEDQPQKSVETKPGDLAGIESEQDRQLVKVARSYKGSYNFRGPEVDGGNLACAMVASTILKDAGAIDKVILGVDGVEAELVKRGWVKHDRPAQAGDVVVWGRTPSRIGNDGLTRLGHKHIGVMTTDKLAVNNSSSQKMPVENYVDFNSQRGVYFLSPPHRSSRVV